MSWEEEEYWECEDCGFEACENKQRLISGKDCMCAGLHYDKMCDPCRAEYVCRQQLEAEDAMLKSGKMYECEICDAPSEQKRCRAHRE